MTPLSEQLSQLWSNDLPDDEARALHARIAAEPQVAAEWQRLCRAMDALAELPDAMPAPPLRARRRPLLQGKAWIPWLIAAAAAGLWLLPSANPDIVLVSGNQWVEGDLRLLAGDATVDVDGRVWVSVEPADGVPRVGAAKEDDMNKSTVIAGLAGVVVTVAVFEGTAVVHAAGGGAPITLAAGEQRQVGTHKAPAVAPLSAAEQHANIARLQAELDAAQQALAVSKFEGALTRGQLAALQGTPSPWPAAFPAEVGPERFRAELEAKLADVPDVAVDLVDCDEYPCIAAVRYTGTAPGDEWNQPMGEAVRGWAEGVFGADGVSLSVNTSRFRDGEKDERYVIFGAHDAGRDTDVGTRTDYRIDAMVDELGDRMKDEAPTP